MALPAEHPGVCAACGERFDRGERIRWRTNVGYTPEPEVETPGWGHEVCPEPKDPLGADHPPCPDCFLVHPPGACDR